MKSKAQHAASGESNAWPAVMSWVGRATALIGLFASLAGGVTWLVHRHIADAERKAKMGLAEAQAEQGDYQSSVATYGEILKEDSTYRPALDMQLNTAELWVEDFRVTAPEGQSTAAPAAAMLDQIMPILDAGLTRAQKAQMPDVLAHIGWAHWLNQGIAEREFGDAAEQNLRAALKLDPQNVYANAMLGNWILQNNGDLRDAMRHFDAAVATGKARPLVRGLEMGGLTYLDQKGARAAQVRVADEMRKAGEPLDNEYKSRILSFCFDPVVTDRNELVEALSAVSPDDEWKTYLWLDDNPRNEDHHVTHDFIQANLLEVSGDKAASLAKFRTLQQELKDSNGSMKQSVDAAVARLSHG
jgi:tetratricopeptide (TPR) repeat protein